MEKEMSVRNLESDIDTLAAKEPDLSAQLAESEAALRAFKTIIAQSGDNTKANADHLAGGCLYSSRFNLFSSERHFLGVMFHLEWFLLWNYECVVDNRARLTYDSWFRVEIPKSLKNLADKPLLSLLPNLSSQKAQFPLVNEVLLSLGDRELGALKTRSLVSVRDILPRDPLLLTL